MDHKEVNEVKEANDVYKQKVFFKQNQEVVCIMLVCIIVFILRKTATANKK